MLKNIYYSISKSVKVYVGPFDFEIYDYKKIVSNKDRIAVLKEIMKDDHFNFYHVGHRGLRSYLHEWKAKSLLYKNKDFGSLIIDYETSLTKRIIYLLLSIFE